METGSVARAMIWAFGYAALMVRRAERFASLSLERTKATSGSGSPVMRAGLVRSRTMALNFWTLRSSTRFSSRSMMRMSGVSLRSASTTL